MAEQNNLEVADIEHYKDQDQVFSHQALVMRAMNKCIEFGAKELIEGFYEEQQGSAGTKIIYKEDTRRAFIEAVKTAKMIIVCDFDDDARNNIKELIGSVVTCYEKYVKEQKEWYEKAPYQFKEKYPLDMKYLNPQSQFQQFWNSYINEALDIYREVFEELTLLTKRIKFYGSESFEG